MTDTFFLTLEDLLRLTERLAAGPVKDIGLLDAAAARPRSSAFGTDAYPSIELKAAALLQSIVGNHALVDGNKRLGLLATAVFLDRNGLSITLTDGEAFDLVMDVASGLADIELIARRLTVGPRRAWPTG